MRTLSISLILAGLMVGSVTKAAEPTSDTGKSGSEIANTASAPATAKAGSVTEEADPVQALVAVSKACWGFDVEGLVGALHADNNKDEQDFKASVVQMARSAAKIRDALIAQKVSEKDAASIAEDVTEMRGMTLDQLKGATAKIEDDTAIVTLTGVKGLPPIPMVRINGKWKMSVKKSMEVVGLKTPEEIARFKTETQLTFKALDGITAEIQAGKIKTMEEVRAEYKKLRNPDSK